MLMLLRTITVRAAASGVAMKETIAQESKDIARVNEAELTLGPPSAHVPIRALSNSCACWLAVRRENGTNKSSRSAFRNAAKLAGDRCMKVALYARYSTESA
jgi:hypothetical protein